MTPNQAAFVAAIRSAAASGGIVDLAHAPNPPESLLLQKNGLTMQPGLDFELKASRISFLPPAIPVGTGGPDKLCVWYRY